MRRTNIAGVVQVRSPDVNGAIEGKEEDGAGERDQRSGLLCVSGDSVCERGAQHSTVTVPSSSSSTFRRNETNPNGGRKGGYRLPPKSSPHLAADCTGGKKKEEGGRGDSKQGKGEWWKKRVRLFSDFGLEGKEREREL